MSNEQIELDVQYQVPMDRCGTTNDTARFEQAAIWVAESFGFNRFTASISIVDDPAIHNLNRDHLQHDWPTDVISFVFESDSASVDGEIIASSETAARLHQHARWSLADEILLYVVHGLLHLAGLDDRTEADRQEMRMKEQECLVALGVPNAEQHISRWDST